MDTEWVKDRYESRILLQLHKVCDAVTRHTKFETDGPFEMTDEEYVWSVLLTHPSRRPVDVTLTIVESSVHDGTEDGISFHLSIGAEGGQVLGTLAPFNYSEDVWVPLNDVEAIERRFLYFEDLNMASIRAAVLSGPRSRKAA